ncbi:MAG: hypothetical protein KDM81_05745 [Verrucomicrobiae bacterium]|nr:hypothetical protein [Verrucomicrobiae bacterium]MCP5522545.1 hypothetical protein [Verrucomicrobiales bacterium]
MTVCALLAGATLTGSATRMGPAAIRPDRANYNQGIVDSADEQMLLNLVRLR